MDHPGTINAKGNLGITLRRYARVSEEQGEQLIQETVQYLHQHDYHDAHPWLVKFDNENLIGTAQKLSLQGKHDQSLEMFDTLLKKKQQLMMAGTETSPPKPLSKAVVPVGDSSSAEVAQELLLIGKGKFTSMLGKARSLIMKARHVEARDLLIECSRFPVDLLGDAEDRISLTAEMKTLMTSNALQSADYDKAAALRVETLQLLVDHYGPTSDKLVGIMILIAQSYRGCCSYDEAETFINEVGSEVFQPCIHSLDTCMNGWMIVITEESVSTTCPHLLLSPNLPRQYLLWAVSSRRSSRCWGRRRVPTV